MLHETRWEQWRFGDHWARRLRHAARMSSRIVAISPNLRDDARQLLDVPPEAVESIPNGVDVERFDRQHLDRAERLRRWRHWLVEDPQGWDESGRPGTIRYRDEDLRWFDATGSDDHAPVLMFVGRFTEVKRVPLLLRAYARARERFDDPGAAGALGRLSPASGRASIPTTWRGRSARRDLLRRVARSHGAARRPHLRGRDGRAVRP